MSRAEGPVDSVIEQQLTDDERLFSLMAEGVEDEVEETPEVEEVEETPEVVEDEPEETQEEEEAEEAEEVTDTTDEDNSSNLYTPEEIKQILASGDFSQIDTSRLSEEGKLVMKSMQSGLTPKLQEAAQLRKEMEELRKSVEKAIPKPAPKDIYEAYDQDPEGVLTFIDNAIDEAIDNEDLKGVKKLEVYRQRLKEYANEKKEKATLEPQKQQQVAAETAAKLLRAIPDIEKRQAELREYALTVMGYDPQELDEATHIMRGDAAVREIVRINNAYSKHVASTTAKAKATRKVATPVEKSGGGFDKKQETTIKDRIKEAKKKAAEGDQSAFYDVFYHMED